MHGALWHREGPKTTPWPPAKEPAKATPLGDADREPLGIYIGSSATEKIEEALANNPDAPVTGLLAGLPLTSSRRPFILVTHALPVDIPVNEDGEPEFSSDVFADAYADFAELGGGLCVVGWFSARPRKAPEMSAYERYSHRKHFPERWQVAFLIDSTRGTSRLYRWDDERLVACNHFYFWNSASEPVESLLADERPQPATIPTLIVYDESAYDEPAAAAEEPESKRRLPVALWLSAAALLLLIYLLIPQAPGSIFWLRARQADQATGLMRLEQDLAALEREGERLQSLLNQSSASQGASGPSGSGTDGGSQPQGAVAASRPAAPVVGAQQAPQTAQPAGSQTSGAQTAQPPGSQAPQGSAPPAQQQGAPAVSQQGAAAPSPPPAGQGSSGATEYVIQPGDTMWSISRTLLGDPWQFRALAEENNIEDPSLIFPGQRLRIPRTTDSER